MTLVIAHRGFCAHSPENTLSSIKHAVELGCDGVEFDVRATKDGHLVLFHDKTLKRMCGRSGSLASFNYADLLRFSVKGESIPLLDDVLRYLAQTSLSLIVPEIKVEGFEKEIYHLISKHGLLPRTIVSSKSTKAVRIFREIDPELRLAYVMDNRPDRLKTWKNLNKEIGLFSVHHFHNRPISNARFISKLKSEGLRVMPWFLINTEQEKRMEKLLSLGVDGMITDRPDRLISLLQKT